jgi:archaellum component FlaG (FlaF/FlaG flagellin family)
MIFVVIVLSSVIGYFTYGVNLIEKVSDEVTMKGIQSLDKSKETFEIVNVGITDGKFDLTIKNTGQLPIHFTRMWVNNMTDSSWPLQNFTLNEISAPGQISYDVGQNLELYALESQSYDLRLVTERGNLFNVQITSPQDESLEMNLFSTSKSVLTGQNVTLWFGVTNNVTDGSVLQLITPQIEDPPDVIGGASATYKEGPIPSSKESLSPGDTAFFKWVYEVSGNYGDEITFNATVNNAKQGNFAEENVAFFTLDADSVSAQNAGVLQVQYDSLEWTQGSSWSSGWNLSTNTDTVWRIIITNNDPTNTFYIGEDSALLLTRVGGATNEFYIVDSATTTPTVTAYTEHDQSIGPGDELLVYFGATTSGGAIESKTPANKGINESPILMFGEMCSGGSCPGTGSSYGQTIPFLGILLE